jgi:hypothetical protein
MKAVKVRFTPKRKSTRAEVARAIKKSRLKFFRSWEQMRADTREL